MVKACRHGLCDAKTFPFPSFISRYARCYFIQLNYYDFRHIIHSHGARTEQIYRFDNPITSLHCFSMVQVPNYRNNS